MVSPQATAFEQEGNGWRMLVEERGYRNEPIGQQPAPRLDARPSGLCPLDQIVGESAPKRLTFDVNYATLARCKPIFLSFMTGAQAMGGWS